MTDQWSELKKRVRKLTCNITYNDYNIMNRRLGGDVLGGESSFDGFTLVVIYYQLSTNIDMDSAMKMISLINRQAGSSKMDKFLQFFVNDKDGNLIYYEKGIVPESGARRMVRDYYGKYADDNKQYSRTLRQLNPAPKYGRYVNARAAKSQLFVVVHDNDGIDISPDVGNIIEQFKKRWLFVCLDRHHDMRVSSYDQFLEP